jgi:hypothetical protein
MTANPVHIHAFDEIGLKEATEEVLEVVGNGFVHIGSEGVLPVHLVVQHFLAIGFVERVVPVDHNEETDAQSPHVSLQGVVKCFPDDLRGVIARGTCG